MGMETLPLRMDKHCANALEVATFLEKHPKVQWVSYPGLPSHPNHQLVKKYSPKGASGLFTFAVKGGYDAAQKLVDSLTMVNLIANLGDVRTLVAHPASMMHRQLSDEQRQKAGAGLDVIRLSIGIEDARDIIADLSQALDQV